MTTAVKPPRSLLRLAGQAIADYAMVRSGDRLLLGLSGGKDSLSLLHVLLHLRDKSPVHFELAIATVDPCIDGYDPFYLKDYVASLGLPYFYRRQTIVARALKTMRGDSFCAYCARMRRGFSTTPRGSKATMYWCWRSIWTIWPNPSWMSAFYNGRLRTMKAHYVNDAGDLRIIRPLVYVRERQTADFDARAGLPVIKDNCPACFRMPTKRQYIKNLLAVQESENKLLFGSLLSTMRPLMTESAEEYKLDSHSTYKLVK